MPVSEGHICSPLCHSLPRSNNCLPAAKQSHLLSLQRFVSATSTVAEVTNSQMAEESSKSKQRYKTLAEFYPHYKSEHQQTGTRVLHFVGTSLFLAQAAAAAHARNPKLLLSGIISAYGCAWLGHFFVEKNRPATFQYPLMSLVSDFKLYFNIVTGREPLMIAAS